VSSPLLVDEPAPHVRRLTLNRPERLNTITSELAEALHGALREVGADRSCRAVVLTGAGRAFSAGLDLAGYGAAPGNDGSDQPRDRLANQQHMSTLILALRMLPQPVIAAVDGPAAGFGLALALGSDIRYASRDAVFRAAFINIGVSNCDMGTSWLLPRLIGASRSHELMLTGRRVGADEALQIGLVADVVDGDRLTSVKVEARVVAHERGPKLRIVKFKPKRGYKRRTGHRQELTRLEVTGIKVSGGKRGAAKKAASSPKPVAAEPAPVAVAAEPQAVETAPEAVETAPEVAALEPEVPEAPEPETTTTTEDEDGA